MFTKANMDDSDDERADDEAVAIAHMAGSDDE
jgi:hypothetical protein